MLRRTITQPTSTMPRPRSSCGFHRERWRSSVSSGAARAFASSDGASCMPWPICRHGPTRAASRPPSTPSTWSITAEVRAMNGETLDTNGRTAQAACPGSAPTPVSCPARRHGPARCPGPDGAPLLLARQIAPHAANRLSRRKRDGTRGRDARAWHRNHMGRGHPDLGRQPDCRGSRCGDCDVPPDPGHALRDPAVHRAWHLPTRLPAAEGSPGPSPDHERCDLDTRDQRSPAAPFFLDQRVERACRGQWQTIGDRTDPAGLVLCRRARSCPRVDHRPGLFPADRRDRALALSPRAQARRAPTGGLAIRLPAPAPKVWQCCPLLGLCPRSSCTGRPPVPARLPAGHRADGALHRAAGVQARAVGGTGISRGQAVKPVVLSGANALVPSGAALSCYQAHRIGRRPVNSGPAACLNLTNSRSLTCCCRFEAIQAIHARRHARVEAGS
ncbi:hypothetical protein AB691_1900 [Stutzerimonas stutzeri]|nr:hypothetical protein AB691_1900 [Stutzerimonas stutzeri]